MTTANDLAGFFLDTGRQGDTVEARTTGEITVNERVEIKQLIKKPRGRTRYDKLQPFAFASYLCDRWFNGEAQGGARGLGGNSFEQYIPSTSTTSLAGMDDETFMEANRVFSMIRKRSDLKYKILAAYFYKDDEGKTEAMSTIAHRFKSQGATYYFVGNVITDECQFIQNHINWKLIRD